MIFQISNTYKEYIDGAVSAKAGLTALKENLNTVKGAQIKLDIEQLDLNKSLLARIEEI